MQVKKLQFIIFAGILSVQISYGQWQADVRLTNDPAHSITASDNSWCIASSGSVVHIVWFDFRDVTREIYYKRSTDDGLSWSSDTRLSDLTFDSEYPSVTVNGQNVYVAWDDARNGAANIYFKRSTDGGQTWGADT